MTLELYREKGEESGNYYNILRLHRAMLELYRENGKENGNYYRILRSHMG